MKLLRNPIGACLLLLSATLFFSCGDDELTKQQKVTKLLTQDGGMWTASGTANSIILEGIDVKDELFPGLEMTFTKQNINTSGDSPFWDATTGDNPIWPATDTWSFKDKNADVLIRGDGREIIIVSITSTVLVFQFEWDGETTSAGRTKSLPGLYEFTLEKN